MLIEKDARRFILEAIKYDKEIRTIEAHEKLKGEIIIKNYEYNVLRKKFAEVCGKINSVANTQGKGRDDLNIDILVTAEDIYRKISDYKSRAVRKLSYEIKQSFQNLRCLFRKYSENLEAVDPQLKNNPDLITALTAYERSWEKGKDFLLDCAKHDILLSMSELIEGLIEKYNEVKMKIEEADTDVFIMVPCLAILKAIDEEDTILYSMFYSNKDEEHMEKYKVIKNEYNIMQIGSVGYEVYNAIERMILEKTIDDKLVKWSNNERIKKLVHDIKELAIMLQRIKPTEWNSLMETAMGII